MKVNRIVWVLCVLLFASLSIYAGTTGKIVGTVTDNGNGEPLIGVNVILEGTTLGATTDLDGSYLILNVPPGSYTVIFQYLGYRDVRIAPVNVSVDFTTRLSTKMEEASVELGETVEVVADREVIRRDLTSSQAEVSADEIANIPVEEFEDVLQLQAGVTRGEGGGFHIRGGRSSEVAYWVDGVSVTDAFDGSNAVEIENNAIQSLQVISGTFNAEYGQAMSGIINIVTKEGGSELTGNISAYAGDYFSNDSYGATDVFDPNSNDQVYLNLDDVAPSQIYNVNASLDGPIPGTKSKGRFFVNFRRFYNEGYLYGRRDWRADGDTTLVRASNRFEVLGTPGDGAIVPMNSESWYSGQANLTYQLTNLIKARVKFNYEDREFRDYDHFYKLNPDGDYSKFQTGYNGTVSLDHTLSNRAFYTLKFSQFEKEFTQYVYEDPSDSRYTNNDKFSVPSLNFSIGGQKNEHFNRITRTQIAKFDFTAQVNDKHLMKAGIEARRHKLSYEQFNVIDSNLSDTLFTAVKPGINDPNFTAYTFEPEEFSVYVQDKMEYEDFIVNIGLRLDYFNSNGRVLADPLDPNIQSPLLSANQDLTLAEREAIWYDDPSSKVQVSPRVGVAYPISSQGVVHFSYGHFLQIPEFRLLYDNPEFRVTRQNGSGNLIGNSDLDAQKTVMYEIGLQQQLTEDIGVDITGFYRDIRDWVGTSPLQITYAPDVSYSKYENRDYANIRGLTIAFKKRFSSNFSANVDYTFQVAEGNSSDPADAFNDAQANREPRREIIPLDWDRSHVLNGNVYIGIGGWGTSILGRFESGLPYTPQVLTAATSGSSIQSGLTENSERRPNLLTFDLQLFRDFRFNNMNVSLFAKIYNLLDSRGEQSVWGDSGRATYTLQNTTQGSADPEYLVQPQFYTEPRRIQVGFNLGF
ncbi:MAG: TonB-dependent receptor [Calditrichaeota bacterium]|nr:TonB-dependent receptor [Calditrichota bacterium]